nr:MAG TPA: hypothetical protein [Crassvirales sp.]
MYSLYTFKGVNSILYICFYIPSIGGYLYTPIGYIFIILYRCIVYSFILFLYSLYSI